MTKYNNDMPNKLLKAMKNGHSFQGACGVLGIARSCGYQWVEDHEEFKKAKEEGDMFALKFFEQIALSKLTGVMPQSLKAQGSKVIDTTMAIFMLKTRFHKIYGDKMKLESSTDNDNKVQINLNYKKPKTKKKSKVKK